MTAFRRFSRDDEGATAIEYALIASIVALIAIGGITAFSGAAVAMWNNIANHL